VSREASRLILAVLAATLTMSAQTKPRARDLGVLFEGTPGQLDAITDVPGVEVGHKTLISGDNVRTGVTAVWPRGKKSNDPVFGGFFSQNGNGDMTGTHWITECGFLDGPVLITNTSSVGVVREAFLGWLVKNHRMPGTNTFDGHFYTYPVVAETWDGFLNDINGFHVKPTHVEEALDSASSGPVPEGNVGGGTGMICYGFKGGIGTASRKLAPNQGGYTVGAFSAMQLWRPPPTSRGRPSGWRGDRGTNASRGCVAHVPRGRWFHHYSGCHRRSAPSSPGAAAVPPRYYGSGPHWLYFGKRFGRYLHRIQHGELQHGRGYGSRHCHHVAQ
jgi:hypothetical protein